MSGSRFRRSAAALFDQQLWCFGRDIAHPAGNVLVDLKFCRYPAPSPHAGSTLYTAPIEPGGTVFLWGFGAMYTEPGRGGVFLRRATFAPRLTLRESAVGVHQPDDLGPLTNPRTPSEFDVVHQLLPRLVGWFARYEHWIAESFGVAYRQDCLASRSRAPMTPGPHMARDWERAAKKCRQFARHPARPIGPWAQVLSRLRPPAVRSAPPRYLRVI